MTNAPNFPAKPNEGGKGGEGGVSAITNHDFLRAIFQKIPESAFVAICRKPGDPTEGPWICKKATDF